MSDGDTDEGLHEQISRLEAQIEALAAGVSAAFARPVARAPWTRLECAVILATTW